MAETLYGLGHEVHFGGTYKSGLTTGKYKIKYIDRLISIDDDYAKLRAIRAKIYEYFYRQTPMPL